MDIEREREEEKHETTERERNEVKLERSMINV